MQISLEVQVKGFQDKKLRTTGVAHVYLIPWLFQTSVELVYRFLYTVNTSFDTHIYKKVLPCEW